MIKTYMMLNGAIAAGYLLSRMVISFPGINQHIQQIHQLKFARYCLLITITVFLVMPMLTNLQPIKHANLEFEPVFHHASHFISQSQQAVTSQLPAINRMPFSFSLKKILIVLWITGFLISLFKYIKTISLLFKLQRDAFLQHKIHHTHILFTHFSDTPFCWSFLHKNYIALPIHLTEHISDKKISLRHELQHIRQGDTRWLHFMQILKLLCFWNPFIKLWMNWFSELQEFACDENIVLSRKISPAVYAQCLINGARHTLHSNLLTNSVIAINGLSKSTLHRRVNMMFTYKKSKRKLTLISAYTISIFAISSAAFALNGSPHFTPVSQHKVASIVNKSQLDKVFHIKATPEVVAEINRIRTNDTARAKMLGAIERMNEYKSYLKSEFAKNSMPDDLLALPLIESGYKSLDEKVNPMRAAGIWQIIPSTATHLGLVVDKKRDDRMNMELATQAAIKYLNSLYTQFHDWKLAIMAYEIGENQTEHLIHATGSRDAWTFTRSDEFTKNQQKEVRKYLAMFDAAVIIINNPDLIS